MTYFLNLFSPETYTAFSQTDRDIVGFRTRYRKAAEKVRPKDVFICYLTSLSRWVGLLEVMSGAFEDTSPLLIEKDDPFTVRFKVKPLVWLPPERAIPIQEDVMWARLSFTKVHEPTSTNWSGAVRTSLARITEANAKVVGGMLLAQTTKPKKFPLTPTEARVFKSHRIRRQDGELIVSVPDDTDVDTAARVSLEGREATKVQALLAVVGARMGFRVWVPPDDRAGVLREVPMVDESLLGALPVNYDETTVRTLEAMDVLWFKGRIVSRAFEVSHTATLYSSILRLADLISLQPNMDLQLHLAAPDFRKQKVFDEIRRPVFALLEGKGLADCCTFLSYETIRELAGVKHLEHLSDSVLEEYEEVVGP